MTTNAGLWIDHREAVIVTLTGTEEETRRISSNTERQFGHSSKPEHSAFEAHHPPADDAREREYTGHLARYYDEIVSQVSGAEAIFIFGPGEAKGELKKRFGRHPHDTRVILLETADKMTEPQIVARVRHHFHCDPIRQ